MSTARRLWSRLELVHDVVYFAPACAAALSAAGYRGFWMGYFAQRAAPFGAVPPAVVTATFHGFHPRLVERALPDAWSFAPPEVALRTRSESSAGVLRDLAASAGVREAEVARAAELAWQVAAAADCSGRALGAANQALPRPADPYAALWQAAATLREHRGDGHIAVLVARGITPLVAHHLKIAAGESVDELLRRARGFDEAEWAAGRAAAVDTGWVAADGTLTAAGRAEHDAVEAATDAAAAQPVAALGAEEVAGLVAAVEPLALAVRAAGFIPQPNPVGLVWPE